MGAISMLDGRAHIDEDICAGCAACQSVCLQNAIISVEVIEPPEAETEASLPVPLPAQAEPAQPRPSAPAMRDLVAPAISSLLIWTGREIVPRLERLVLEALDRRLQSTGPAARSMQSQRYAQAARGRGHRRHLRRRRRTRF